MGNLHRLMKHVSGVGSGRTFHGCSRDDLSCTGVFHVDEEHANFVGGFLFFLFVHGLFMFVATRLADFLLIEAGLRYSEHSKF